MCLSDKDFPSKQNNLVGYRWYFLCSYFIYISLHIFAYISLCSYLLCYALPLPPLSQYLVEVVDTVHTSSLLFFTQKQTHSNLLQSLVSLTCTDSDWPLVAVTDPLSQQILRLVRLKYTVTLDTSPHSLSAILVWTPNTNVSTEEFDFVYYHSYLSYIWHTGIYSVLVTV